MKFYAVREGRNPGIYDNWEECKEQVHKFPKPQFKKFNNLEDAENYLDEELVKKSPKFDSEEEVLSQLNEGEMIAYVDGSSLSDGSAFSWGVVMFTKKFGKVNINNRSSDKDIIQYRNVAGELYATITAVKFAIANGIEKIIIYHDYTGIRHWALGEWKTNNPLTQSYKRFFQSIKEDIQYEFVKVEGHTGDKFNEEADILAKEALNLK